MGKKRRKQDPLSYQERVYHRCVATDLVISRIRLMETDLTIQAERDVSAEALAEVIRVRDQLESYIRSHPDFLHSLEPLPFQRQAPSIVRQMLAAAQAAGVGPMAAVAGAIAEAVGQRLREEGLREIVVENGGDIYVARLRPCRIAIYAGQSALSGRIGIELVSAAMPCGVCTSSATIGHSLSLGKADAAVVVAESTALADAAATRLGNAVSAGRRSISQALASIGETVDGIRGALVICGNQLGAWGDVTLTGIGREEEKSS